MLHALAAKMRGPGVRFVRMDLGQPSARRLVAHWLEAMILSLDAYPQTAESPEGLADEWTKRIARFPRRYQPWGEGVLDLWEQWQGGMDEIQLLKRCIFLPDGLQKAGRETLWILADNFEGLVAAAGADFIAGPMAEALKRNRRVRWALAGRPIALMERLARGPDAPLSGLVDYFPFSGLAHTEAVALLKRAASATRLDPGHRSFLIAVTGGHPFYLEVLNDGLARVRAKMGRRVNGEAMILEALAQELYSAAGRLHLYFRGFLADAFQRWRSPELYQGMVEAVADGRTSLVGICEYLRRDAPALSRQFQNLLDSGLVAKEGTRYYIPDALLRLWLRHVHGARRSASRVGKTGAEEFRAHFQSLLREFLADAGAETARRLAKILAASDGKTLWPSAGQAKGKGETPGRMLPRFDSVEVDQKLGEERFDVVARSGNEYCVFAVRDETPSETTVFHLAARIDRVRAHASEEQTVHAALVAAGGISRGAARLASKRGLEIWGREEINRLAECYGQLMIFE